MLDINKVHIGDAFELIKQIGDNTVDLVVTSPPYADTVSYGKSISVLSPDNYPSWILPLFRDIHRVLKPTGSFILNINDRIVDKERSVYVYDLITRAVRETDLILFDRYYWHKKSGIPTGGKKRLNDKVEYLFHFVKDKDLFKAYGDRIKQPYAEITLRRFKSPVGIVKKVDENGIATPIQKMLKANPLGATPENVFRFNTAGAIRKKGKLHPAAFHPDLPKWFIKWLTDERDLVLDPFMGSGTTAIAAKEMDRNFVGFELNSAYEAFIKEQLNGNTHEEIEDSGTTEQTEEASIAG